MHLDYKVFGYPVWRSYPTFKMEKNTVRLFKTICYLFFGLNAISCAQRAETVNKPNVVFIICDDLNDYVGLWDKYDQAITPSLDVLSSHGVNFMNAHSNAPLCGPSRASLFTGIYPHNSGFFGYRQHENKWKDNVLLGESENLIDCFANNGYKVFGTGKLFHNHHYAKETFEENGGQYGPQGDFGPFPWNGKNRVVHPSIKKPFGNKPFESFAPLNVIPKVVIKDSMITGWYNDQKPWNYVSDQERDMMDDEKATAFGIQVLEQEHTKPFFLAIGYHRPHRPLYVPVLEV